MFVLIKSAECNFFDRSELTEQLIPNMDDKNFLKQIKEKYLKSEIYSYISDVLIAVNPYKIMDDLYTLETIKKYQGVSIGVLPSHVFAIANAVKRNIRMLQTSQSIIISGESGSGKTETSKLLLKFFCGSNSNNLAQHMINANILLESFGNSRTTENLNSSRFIKTLQVDLDSAGIANGIELQSYSVENSRVCVGCFDTFHIFYYLAYGAPEVLAKKLQLKQCSFSCLPKQYENQTNQAMSNFANIHQILVSLGVEDIEIATIYENIAAILHLGNIKFESSDSGTQIIESTKEHVVIAAKLMNIFAAELENAILFRLIEVAGSTISSPLSEFAACKARDTLSKMIYTNLFHSIVSYINRAFTCNHQSAKITILDIAGFECFNSSSNRFEQFCINYSNEKIQKFCTQRLICDEQNWYKSEGIDIPEITFPGNSIILDIFESKTSGIFSLLDEECRMPNPQTKSFMQKVISTHERCSAFSFIHSNKATSRNTQCGFAIRHFGHNVFYSTENFIENNAEVYSKSLCNIANKSLKTLSTIKSNYGSNIGKEKKKTFSSTFRTDLQLLISKLEQTRSYFVRCVKPNLKQVPNFFDEIVVSKQLESSGTLAYYNLMQCGYPIKIGIVEFYNKLKIRLEPRHISIGVHNCCKLFLLAIGFLSKDFKFGKTEIHIRPGNNHLVDLLNVELERPSNETTVKIKREFNAFMRHALFDTIWFIGAVQLKIRKRQVSEQNTQICIALEQSNFTVPSDPLVPVLSAIPVITSSHEPLKKPEFSRELREALPEIVPRKRSETKKSAYEKLPKPSIRFNGLMHPINYDQDRLGCRCKMEGCGKQTPVYCERCKVHLCFLPGKKGRNCFRKFHSIDDS